MYFHYDLKSEAEPLKVVVRLTCWLEWDRKLKLGTRLTLEEYPDMTWEVMSAGKEGLDEPPLTTWKVGGLL